MKQNGNKYYSLGLMAVSVLAIAASGCTDSNREKVTAERETDTETITTTTSRSTTPQADTQSSREVITAEATLPAKRQAAHPNTSQYMPTNEKPARVKKTIRSEKFIRATSSTSSGMTQSERDFRSYEPASNMWEDGTRVRNENSTNNYQFKNATSPPGENSL